MLDKRVNRNDRYIRALILTPTRELALQIKDSLKTYGRHLKLRTAVVLGGVPAAKQINALKNNPDILVATPGRLLDLHNQGFIHLNRVEMLVLDEADRMLDMGFIHDVRKIVAKLPKKRQTLLFSATLSWEITNLSSDMLRNPSLVEVTPAASVSVDITQNVLFVEHMNKRELLTDILKKDNVQRALVFARTKRRADNLTRQLSRKGISAAVIHSNKSQNARQRALAEFDKGIVKVLVATDIVARGIDVDGISHVINFEMPNDSESYVHRIGRTARAGATGTALSFCGAEEIKILMGIEKLTGMPLTALEDHPYHSSYIAGLRERSAASPAAPNKQKTLRSARARKPFVRRGIR